MMDNFPLLSAITYLPVIGALLIFLIPNVTRETARVIALVAALGSFALSIVMLIGFDNNAEFQFDEHVEWLTDVGVSYHLGVDGIAVLLIALTTLLSVIAIIWSWDTVNTRTREYYVALLLLETGMLGVFVALDLFIFYIFWEIMLIPMALLIGVWGSANRVYAAVKFFIFTQASGLLMLLAILTLFFLHHQQTGVYTFAYAQLLGTPMGPSTAMWLMLGFFVAFAVKLPAVPFHTWLPDAHTEAPTAGSVILAGLLLKTGAYGMLRFVLPLFPQAAWLFAPAAMVLAVTGILYGAVLAFAQTDLKRLVAYTSISHLGFVLLGIFAWNELALQGAVLQMICHGISTGALFMLAGALQARLHTRDMRRMGGLWSTTPRLGGVGLFFAMAALGLPGLGNFLAEFLVLVGSFRVSALLTMVATLGLVTATVYALRVVQRTFHGPNTEGWRIPDLTARDMATMAVMIAALVWLGLYPQALLETAAPVLNDLQQVAEPFRIVRR
jgi:NADH-quinone oxidoreductase subunit M